MGIMRRVIFQGDKLSNGGVVKTASGMVNVGGRTIAVAGDLGFCPVCKMDAPIVPINPSHVHYPNGKQNLLEGDKLDCHCPQKPVCMAADSTTYSVEDNITPPNYNPVVNSHIPRERPANPDEGYNHFYKILHRQTGEPLANIRYALERPDGSLEYGTTNADGSTHTLQASIGQEFIRIHFEGDDGV